MSEKTPSDRNEEIHGTAEYRVRRADFVSGLSVASLIALISLAYSIFRNFNTDITRVVESFQSQVSRQIERLDDRVQRCCERRR